MKIVYLLGIGGAGMAGLARFFQQKGLTVGGYDRAKSVTTAHLEQIGIAVDYAPNPSRLEKADLCVYSAAVTAVSMVMLYTETEIGNETTAQ